MHTLKNFVMLEVKTPSIILAFSSTFSSAPLINVLVENGPSSGMTYDEGLAKMLIYNAEKIVCRSVHFFVKVGCYWGIVHFVFCNCHFLLS